jgi:integrase
VDIFGLELTDIDWRKNEIALAQSKTGEAIHLPLMADVGNAIADYILHGRPKSDSPHIFLRVVKPHVRLGSIGNGKNIISRYLSKAGVMHEAWDGKTFHAFRRTQGTRLLEAGVPLPDVAAMLGQLDIDSPKRYISNNEVKMRECCLDISEFATQKEGLS